MRVWVSLADLFGKGFYREHGETPGRLWQEAIWRLSDKQVANGMINLADDGLSYPPNLSQFVAACKREKIRPPYWDAPKQIEDKREPGRMSFAEWKKKNDL